MGRIQRRQPSYGVGGIVPKATWIYPAEIMVDKIYCNRENRGRLKDLGIKHLGKLLGRPSEKNRVEYDPGRPKSDRGEVRSGEGEIWNGSYKGETEGHLGIMGSHDPCGDEPGKVGQRGPLFWASFENATFGNIFPGYDSENQGKSNEFNSVFRISNETFSVDPILGFVRECDDWKSFSRISSGKSGIIGFWLFLFWDTNW